MSSALREGLREIGRKFKRVGLRRRIAAADRARDENLTALGRRAWEAKVAVPAADELAQRITGTETQETAVTARRAALDQQRKEHEDKKQAESLRFGSLEQEVRQRKAPVDADLAARRAEMARAQGEAAAVKKRLLEIDASRRALEGRAPGAPTGETPPVDRATVEAQLEALAREREESEKRIGPLTEAGSAAAADIQRLEAQSRELQAELDRVTAERRRTLGEIDRALADVRRASAEAGAEGVSVQKQQAAYFKELGTLLFSSAVDEPALASAMTAVRAADARRRELQAAFDALVAESKAMPRRTMLRFTALVVASLVLVAVLAALRPTARVREFSPAVQFPRDPVKTEITAYGGTVELPGVASVVFGSGALSTTQTVTVAATASPETAEDFRETAVLFAPGPRLPYEVRINTGSVAPIANTEVALRLVVPESFARAQPPNYAIRVFAQILQDSGEEVHDGFRPVDAVDAGDGKSIEVRLRRPAFTNQRRRDGTFEAVVILASSRVGPPRRSRGQSAVPAHASIAQLPDLQWLRDRIRDLVQGPPPCKPVCNAWAPPVIPLTVNPKRPYNPTNDHYGTDYRAPEGQAVYAVARGTIVAVGSTKTRGLTEKSSAGLMTRGYGLRVIIEHCDGSRTLYAHLKSGSTDYLRVGHTVSAGEQIGEADTTGAVTGPHLHLEYAPNGQAGKTNTENPHQCLPYKQ